MVMFHGLPSALRIKIKGIDYVKVDGLDTKSSKKKAWYWGDQGIELIRVTQGRDSNGQYLRNRLYWKCVHCNEVQSKTANAKNKEGHLQRVHSITQQGRRTPLNSMDYHTKKQAAASSTTPSTESTLRTVEKFTSLTHRVVSDPFRTALITFLVICQLPFAFVVNTLFVEFLKVLYPAIETLIPKAGDTIRGWVLDAYKARKQDLIEELHRTKGMVHFSFDLWTSPNHLAILGIVAHYIDPYGRCQSTLIAMRQLHGAHTGENQAEVLIEVIKEYGLQERVGYFVTDNASNNDVAIDQMLSHFFPNMTTAKRKARRLRCLGHVINLSAKAFFYGTEFDAFERYANQWRERSELVKELQLWRKRGPIGKLHNVVTFICRTPQRRERFKKIRPFVDTEDSAYNDLQLVTDNATRWNSLYAMIERALKLRPRITEFCDENRTATHGNLQRASANDEEKQQLLSNDTLTPDDWDTLKETLVILQPFVDCTIHSQGAGKRQASDRGVLSDYMVVLNDLLSHMREMRDDFAQRAANPNLASAHVNELKSCVINAWTKLDEYFNIVNETPAVYASVVTQPQSGWYYFTETWKDVANHRDAHRPRSWIPNAKKSLDSLWDEYKYLPLDHGELSLVPQRREREPNRVQRASDMTQSFAQRPRDELAQWIEDGPFKLDEGTTLAQFWLSKLSKSSTYRLARMGLDLCSIPAMSAECERVFSQTKLLLTSQRQGLKIDIIEATQCLRAWLISDNKRRKGGQVLWQEQDPWITPEVI